MPVNLGFEDRVALVTGGGGGIGRGIALAFANAGATVIVAERDSVRAAAIAQELAAIGGAHMVETVDVCVTDQVRALRASIEGSVGRLDVLVNNVGDFLGLVKPLDRLTDDDFDRLYTINLRQKMVVTREMRPLLARTDDQSGAGETASVINLTSVEGFRGLPNGSAYSSLMAAVHAFSRAAAVELGHQGIRVNTLAVDTTQTETVQPDMITKAQFRDQVRHWFPLGRYGTVEDAAGCALFLGGTLSAWVTGQCLSMDGGSSAAGNHHRLPNGEWTNTPVLTENALMPPPPG